MEYVRLQQISKAKRMGIFYKNNSGRNGETNITHIFLTRWMKLGWIEKNILSHQDKAPAHECVLAVGKLRDLKYEKHWRKCTE